MKGCSHLTPLNVTRVVQLEFMTIALNLFTTNTLILLPDLKFPELCILINSRLNPTSTVVNGNCAADLIIFQS